MGYRSEVAIAIIKDYATEELLNLLADADEKKESYTTYLFKYDWVKWYEDFPEIRRIMEILEGINSKHWGFIRLGEDYGDMEELGSPYAHGIELYRTVSI
jgi:acyl carrier protein phosphodiesterase